MKKSGPSCLSLGFLHSRLMASPSGLVVEVSYPIDHVNPT
jgi:hypothetical protein